MNALSTIEAPIITDARSSFKTQVEAFAKTLPKGVSFQDDRWDLTDWLVNKPNNRRRSVLFHRVRNHELKDATKLWILQCRLTAKVGVGAATTRRDAAIALSRVIGEKPLRSIKSRDFGNAFGWLKSQYSPGTAKRIAHYLSLLARWIHISFGYPVTFSVSSVYASNHGRTGSEEGRQRKLLPEQVLKQLIAANRRDDLIDKDSFYLSVLTVNIACGFRISEMATLPVDCVHYIDDRMQIRYFPAKACKSVPRPIPNEMAPVVDAAIRKLVAHTAPARKILKKRRKVSTIDWSLVYENETFLEYYSSQWASAWVNNPKHRLINPDGAWHEASKRLIDALKAVTDSGGNKSEAARRLGVTRNDLYALLAEQKASLAGRLPPVKQYKRRGRERRSWDTDSRVISLSGFVEHTGIQLKRSNRAHVHRVVARARKAQLEGRNLAAPNFSKEIAEKCKVIHKPLLRTKDGSPVLWPEDALLVIPKYLLSETRSTRSSDVRVVTDNDLSRWLCGEVRGRGSGNHEDSVMRRLGILDPRTGSIARFTWHDMRHWLNTVYQNGGLTEEQIALIFGRRSSQTNDLYDQTSRADRLSRLREAIKGGEVTGVTENIYRKLAQYSREQAEQYLKASLRMVNPMPHGACTLDWSRLPCPHHLSCLSGGSDQKGPCEHLLVDKNDTSQITELKRIKREAQYIVKSLDDNGGSPQVEHYQKVIGNTSEILSSIDRAPGKGD